MAFNKNASKRLSIVAGIDRESRDIADLINTIVQDYLRTVVGRAINVVLFCGRKTVTVDDLRFLSQVCSDQPNIACADNLSRMVKVCVDQQDLEAVLRGDKGYVVYTLKKPFEELVRDTMRGVCREELCVGKNVVPLLQNLTEHYIIKIMNLAATCALCDRRDTLLPRDIETVLKTYHTTNNEQGALL